MLGRWTHPLEGSPHFDLHSLLIALGGSHDMECVSLRTLEEDALSRVEENVAGSGRKISTY